MGAHRGLRVHISGLWVHLHPQRDIKLHPCACPRALYCCKAAGLWHYLPRPAGGRSWTPGTGGQQAHLEAEGGVVGLLQRHLLPLHSQRRACTRTNMVRNVSEREYSMEYSTTLATKFAKVPTVHTDTSIPVCTASLTMRCDILTVSHTVTTYSNNCLNPNTGNVSNFS